MKHHIAYDYEWDGSVIYHEFSTKLEAEAFAEVMHWKYHCYQDRQIIEEEIAKAVGKYLNKKSKNIVVKKLRK